MHYIRPIDLLKNQTTENKKKIIKHIKDIYIVIGEDYNFRYILNKVCIMEVFKKNYSNYVCLEINNELFTSANKIEIQIPNYILTKNYQHRLKLLTENYQHTLRSLKNKY